MGGAYGLYSANILEPSFLSIKIQIKFMSWQLTFSGMCRNKGILRHCSEEISRQQLFFNHHLSIFEIRGHTNFPFHTFSAIITILVSTYVNWVDPTRCKEQQQKLWAGILKKKKDSK